MPNYECHSTTIPTVVYFAFALIAEALTENYLRCSSIGDYETLNHILFQVVFFFIILVLGVEPQHLDQALGVYNAASNKRGCFRYYY